MKNLETLLVGTDLSDRGRIGLEAAVTLANELNLSRIHVLHVVDLPLRSAVLGLPYALPTAVVDTLSKSLIEDAEKRLAQHQFPECRAEITRTAAYGIPAEQITKAAEEVGADLILVTSRGLGGVSRFVLGSLANSLIRTAHCPVLVIREGEKLGPFSSVLAAVDLSPVSASVLRLARAMAAACQGEVRVVSCFEHPLLLGATSTGHPHEVVEELGSRHREALEELVASGPWAEVPTQIEVVEKSPPAQVLVDVANMLTPDLVVVGTSGRNAWRRMLLGSTASRVLNEVPCPVLVVPYDFEAGSHDAPAA